MRRCLDPLCVGLGLDNVFHEPERDPVQFGRAEEDWEQSDTRCHDIPLVRTLGVLLLSDAIAENLFSQNDKRVNEAITNIMMYVWDHVKCVRCEQYTHDVLVLAGSRLLRAHSPQCGAVQNLPGLCQCVQLLWKSASGYSIFLYLHFACTRTHSCEQSLEYLIDAQQSQSHAVAKHSQQPRNFSSWMQSRR